MEHPDRSLSVHHGTGGRGVYSGIARTRVPSAGSEADVSAGPAHRTGFFVGCPPAAATAPGTSGAFPGNVSDAAQFLGHGDVRLRLSLVPDGEHRHGRGTVRCSASFISGT